VKRHPTPVPIEVFDEITGVHEGEALRVARSKRTTDERISRLEDKHDALSAAVSDVRVSVGEMSGKLDTVLAHVIASHQEQTKLETARLGHRAKVIVGVVGALCGVAGVIATALIGGCQ
jgi:hypothetical protein